MPTPEPRRRHFEGARVSSARPSNTPAGARSGKANFDPYWKLSVRSPRTMAWQECRGTYWNPEAARSSAPDFADPGEAVRLVRVAPGLPGGREVVEEFTV